jgi:hypothetical protein
MVRKNKLNHLHVVAFDVPYPADYGGVIDIYHKIRWLHQKGIKVVLHCFQYGRDKSEELNSICEKVYYYKRSRYKNPFIGTTPYIVLTRNNDELFENLCLDNEPILFEGIHTTFFLTHKKLKSRLKIIRNHNIEHDYYKSLELVETNFFKKYFFRNESDNLKIYEKKMKYAKHILAISAADYHHLQKEYHNALLVSAFHENDEVKIRPGRGKFVLYHGNLSVGENNHAALYLVKQVFKHLRIPVVIAGNKPSQELQILCAQFQHIQLIDNWNNEQIMNAITEAHINVLATFQGTGIKLKLLNALYRGRFCVVNSLMVNETGLENLCHIAENPKEMINLIEKIWLEDFTEIQCQERIKTLNNSAYSNDVNIEKIINLLT